MGFHFCIQIVKGRRLGPESRGTAKAVLEAASLETGGGKIGAPDIRGKSGRGFNGLARGRADHR